jgi:hypothetical protein
MTPYWMPGRKRNLVGRGGHSSAEDADRGAMAGGGRGRGGYARREVKQDMIDTTGSRKRKRGQNSSDVDDDQMLLDEPNGLDEEISDENFPKLGKNSKMFFFKANLM